MSKPTVIVYSKGSLRVRIPTSQLSFTAKKDLPCFCFYDDGKKCGIAVEEDVEGLAYYVDIETEKNVYVYPLFEDGKLPEKVGEPIYVTNEGKLTKEKASNKQVGEFLGTAKNAVLFRLA